MVFQIHIDGIFTIPAEGEAPRPIHMHAVTLRHTFQRMRIESGQSQRLRRLCRGDGSSRRTVRAHRAGRTLADLSVSASSAKPLCR